MHVHVHVLRAAAHANEFLPQEDVCTGLAYDMAIPTLDLGLAHSNRQEAARQLVSALESPGFLYLKNVKGYDPDALLRQTKWFFSLSSETRMSLARKAWNPNSKNLYRGYYPVTPNVTCHKEGVEFAQELPADDPDLLSDNVMYEPNMWPPESEAGAAEFKQFMLAYHQSMSELGLEVVRLLAIGIGREEHYLDELFLTKPLSSLRLMHYPPRHGPIPDSAMKDGLTLTCLEHTDTPFVTFLCTFWNAGLQLLNENGVWIDVPLRPDCLVMNAGDTLVKTAGERFRATMHRVVDLGEDRFSVPFFMEPGYASDIGRYARENGGGDEDETEPVLYGQWVAKRMKEKNYTDFPKQSFGNQ